jgi:hypothetical protein
MDSQQSPLAIGTVGFFAKERIKIVNFEKPYHEFAGHFVVQSLYSGRFTNAFKHELCMGEPINEDPETDFLKPSQSDEELSYIDEPGTHDKLRPTFILNVFRKQYCLRTKS